MRMNIKAHLVASPASNLSDGHLALTIRPSASLPGDYSFIIKVGSLRRILRRTDLPSTVIERFESGIWSSKGAQLSGVELSEKTLTEIGYFVD
jgi:hypothetical protein